MPIKTISNSDIHYYLICYDKNGKERIDDPSVPKLSNKVIELVKSGEYTDIFFSSHGWKGDIPAAIDQYDRWMGAMLQCKQDIVRLKSRHQGFKPLIIGLHWPSLPFGMEKHDSKIDTDDAGSFNIPGFSNACNDTSTNIDIQQGVIDTITDSNAGEKALRLILDSITNNSNQDELQPEVEQAIEVLIAEGKTGDEASAPGSDMPPLSAQDLYSAVANNNSRKMVDFGASNGNRNFIINAITQLSIWRMKARARTFGETGAATLLRKLLSITPPSVGTHLMGHSLGCIVVSSAVAGKDAKQPLPRGVNSLYLVGGALSHWAYCRKIPTNNQPGYYQHISSSKFVSGPILVTHTHNDLAVYEIYPIAAKISGAFTGHSFGTTKNYPKYGAIGAHGVRGKDINIHDIKMLPNNSHYSYLSGHFYNIDTSQYMTKMDGLSGAHNDIAHSEVAHAFFSAIK